MLRIRDQGHFATAFVLVQAQFVHIAALPKPTKFAEVVGSMSVR